jgi:hypothetical protein
VKANFLAKLGIALTGSERLLLAVIRSHFDRAQADSLRTGLKQNSVDWSALIYLAKQHKVWPLLYWQLKSICPEGVPPDKLADLHQDFLDNASLAHRHSQALIDLIVQLQARHIRTLPFKGPTLAVAGYGNLTLRPAGDLDLLVDPAEADRAIQLLTEAGYRFASGTRPRRPAERQPHGQLDLRHPGQAGLVVDLHWRLLPVYNRYQPDFERLWAERQTISLLNEPLNTLAPEELLVYLVLHGCKHLWLRSGLICDVAALLDRHRSELDWTRIRTAARQGGYERRLHVALRLCRDLLAIRLPEGIETEMEADPQVASLAGQVSEWLFGPALFRSQVGPASLLFELRTLEQFRDKLRYSWFDALPRLGRQGRFRLKRSLGRK